eukprot:TRINITY_DN3807_c0_g1_i1.p1 TRINITY_DN3807_c0_g1~~TRINITY_DN3807_c0_g1_i1.p1  ORF type:complete len:892 (+),score=142.35 TRINITY_DN3807_c0_g1_i1:126-2801(+)
MPPGMTAVTAARKGMSAGAARGVQPVGSTNFMKGKKKTEEGVDTWCSLDGIEPESIRNDLKLKLSMFMEEHSRKCTDSMVRIVDSEISDILTEVQTHRQEKASVKSDNQSKREDKLEPRGEVVRTGTDALTKENSKHSLKPGESGTAVGEAPKEQKKKPVFADAAAMKEKVRAAVAKKPYNVADFYYEKGMCQQIARSQAFDNITHVVIALNALWIAVETDRNDAVIIWHAHPVFIVAENLFCFYFTWEWAMRFLSFARKRDCFRDAWFCFDSMLVFMMVGETWVMSVIVTFVMEGSSGGLADTSVLKLMRLVRLTRMARMFRLLRAFPELIVLLKGIMVAARSVGFTLVLLAVIIYFYAVIFRQLTERAAAEQESHYLKERYFSTVNQAMGSLLLDGVLPDVADFVRDCFEEDIVFALLMVTFILIASMTLMNMLIGVLCEVVSVVSSVENEALTLNYVKYKLLSMFNDCHADPEQIHKDEFHSILLHEASAKCFQELGVDVVGLVDYSEDIFKDDSTLTFTEFMELVLQMRGSNGSTVKDIVDLRRYILNELASLKQQTQRVSLEVRSIKAEVKTATMKALENAVSEFAAKAPPERKPVPAILESEAPPAWEGRVVESDARRDIVPGKWIYDPQKEKESSSESRHDFEIQRRFGSDARHEEIGGAFGSYNSDSYLINRSSAFSRNFTSGDYHLCSADGHSTVGVARKASSLELTDFSSNRASLTWDPIRSPRRNTDADWTRGSEGPLELSVGLLNCVAPAIVRSSACESTSGKILNITMNDNNSDPIGVACNVDEAPVQAEPVQAEPVTIGYVAAEPVETNPVQANPVQANPVQANPVQANLVQAKPVQAIPVQATVVSPPVHRYRKGRRRKSSSSSSVLSEMISDEMV